MSPTDLARPGIIRSKAARREVVERLAHLARTRRSGEWRPDGAGCRTSGEVLDFRID